MFGDDRENPDGHVEDPNVEEPSETGGDTGDDDRYVSVNEYTGEGYSLNGGEANDKIAQEKFDEIEAGVQAFFLDKYKTEVIVHNAVGNKDGATVFVESKGEPHFHTFAIVPINLESKDIMTENITTENFQVEQAIYTGLIALELEAEFDKLTQFLEVVTEELNITSVRNEVVNNVMSTGYTTPYFYITSLDSRDQINNVVENYFNSPQMLKKI